MALSVVCSCNARFEVEEAFAGQTVSCPECQQPVAVPAARQQPLRTSGFALASVVVGLVLALTFIGPVLAIVLGIAGLIHIARCRRQVAGVGFAIFGIVLGVVFTVLTGLAVLRTELFGLDLLREGVMGAQVERDGPLEISRPDDGFSIRRPSKQWGVANATLAEELVPDSDLVLVNVGRDAYLDVSGDFLGGRSLESYRELLLDGFRDGRNWNNHGNPALRPRGLTVHEKKEVTVAGRHCLQVLFDVKVGPQWLTYLVRLVPGAGGDRVFVVRAWAMKRRFPLIELEIQQALDSFRVLP
ncbi:MAG: DUF4190 domain-containing protein [Planctomycetia bacterium]|nr:DUF4190 domain-containing protein [Planctomycetia bacterium]